MTYCPNVSCPARIYEGIVHFASRGAMDIRGLGYERVRALLDAKLIDDVADLYDRKRVHLLPLLAIEGFAQKSAQQLLKLSPIMGVSLTHWEQTSFLCLMMPIQKCARQRLRQWRVQVFRV